MSTKSERAIAIVDKQMPDLSNDLVNSNELVTGRLAETNVTGTGMDDYEILEAYFMRGMKATIHFKVQVNLSGDQSPDHLFLGDRFEVVVSGEVKADGGSWYIEDYRVESWNSNLDDGPPELIEH